MSENGDNVLDFNERIQDENGKLPSAREMMALIIYAAKLKRDVETDEGAKAVDASLSEFGLDQQVRGLVMGLYFGTRFPKHTQEQLDKCAVLVEKLKHIVGDLDKNSHE